jgi:hypothetical protein
MQGIFDVSVAADRNKRLRGLFHLKTCFLPPPGLLWGLATGEGSIGIWLRLKHHNDETFSLELH